MAPATTTSYLGLRLAHPFILGASPLTASIDHVRRAVDGGCAAVVMHSLFEEQIQEAGVTRLADLARLSTSSNAVLEHFPGLHEIQGTPAQYLEQLRHIKDAVAVPVIASLNGAGPDGWLAFGRQMAEAGADALELNVYMFSTDVRDTASAIEGRIEALVHRLKDLVDIPVAVKLPPFFTAFGNLARRLDAAGADGLVLFNRFYQPDVDVETLEPLANLHLSTSEELLIRLRWLGILSEKVKCSLAVTGGVHQVTDGIKAILSGAHAVQMVSAVLQQGPDHFRHMEQGLRAWMVRHRYESIDAFRGQLHAQPQAHRTQAERAGYADLLKAWSGGGSSARTAARPHGPCGSSTRAGMPA
jgi:dihydroorotate dehydrogenase (fumarate)